MRRTSQLLVLCALAACAAPPPEPTTVVVVKEPEPAPVAPPPLPSLVEPGRVVAVLVAGEPSPAAELSELVALGDDAVAYLGTCRDRDNRPNDTLQWDAASSAPVCVRILFAPPAPLPIAGGPPVEAGEMLVPLGVPHLDGFVFVRAASGHAAFLGGDTALLARIKQQAVGTLSATAMTD